MKLARIAPALLPLALATGCATILRGSHQSVRVETGPPGATASADGETITTPGVLRISRQSKTLEVLVEKDGYVSARVPLVRKLVPLPLPGELVLAVTAMVGGAVTQSWIGAIALPAAAVGIDVATGANHRIEPSKIFLRLEPATALESDGAGGPQ